MPAKPKRIRETKTPYRAKRKLTPQKKAAARLQRTEHPHVVKRLGFRGGRPILRDTSMPVWLIAAMWKSGDTPDEVLRAYPHLKLAAIYDAISYYLDHQKEIEAQIDENRIERVLKDNQATMSEDGIITFPNG